MENANNMEVFKDIQGNPNYQISNMGRIWSKYQQKYKSTFKNNSGYEQVSLKAANGKWKKELVHRLVALTFIDNPDKLPEVEHKDRNRLNNTVENLCWVSRSGNCRNTEQNRMLKVYKNDEFIGIYCLTEAAEIIDCSRSSIYSYFYRNQRYINKIYRLENL